MQVNFYSSLTYLKMAVFDLPICCAPSLSDCTMLDIASMMSVINGHAMCEQIECPYAAIIIMLRVRTNSIAIIAV